MHPSELEALVLTALDRARASQQVESDLIEFKRQWPNPKESARQLAGAANRARGEPLIYVIGADETGKVTKLRPLDMAGWVDQLSAAFDGAAPIIARQMTVQVSDAAQVVVLMFDTDRAPYVVKVENGGKTERDVPWREGTRTRSAKREELLRLLVPTIHLPPITLLSAKVELREPHVYAERDGVRWTISLSTRIYIEQSSLIPTFLPVHGAVATLRAGDFETALPGAASPSTWRFPLSQPPNPPPALYGVVASTDGTTAFTPGTTWLNWELSEHSSPPITEMSAAKAWNLHLRLPIASGERAVEIEARLCMPQSRTDAHDGLEVTWSYRPGAC